jgi:hypothetical protein
MEEILLHNISLKYLNKSLDKLKKNEPINISLIYAINKKYSLGNNYLIYSDIYNNDIQQIKHIEQILIEIIKKLSNLKKYKIHIMPSSPPSLYTPALPSSLPSPPSLYTPALPSSILSPLSTSIIPPSGLPLSPPDLSVHGLSSSIIDLPTTTNFLFRPEKDLTDKDKILDEETCRNQLLFFLRHNDIINSEGHIDKSKQLPKSEYIEFVRLMGSTKSEFSVLQIDDCLRQLGVDVKDKDTFKS